MIKDRPEIKLPDETVMDKIYLIRAKKVGRIYNLEVTDCDLKLGWNKVGYEEATIRQYDILILPSFDF